MELAIFTYFILGLALFTSQHIFGTFQACVEKMRGKYSKTAIFFGYLCGLIVFTIIWPYMLLTGRK